MDIKQCNQLNQWIENKYGTKALVMNKERSISFDRNFVQQHGVRIHTDGVKEINEKDKFNFLTVSGYNYAMLCCYGKQFLNPNEPRILVYLNKTSSWDFSKFKKAVKESLSMYK